MESNKLLNNQKAAIAVQALDVANIGVIFALFLRDSWHRLLEDTVKVVVFPATPILSLFIFILSARQAYIDKKKSSLHNAIANGVAFVGFSLAVGMAFLGGLALAALVPIIFVTTTVVKAVFHAVNAVHYWVKSMTPNVDPALQAEHRQLAKGHATGFLIGSLIAVAVGCTMIMGAHAFAMFGVVAAAIALAHITHTVVKMVMASDYKKLVDSEDGIEIDTAAKHSQLKNGLVHESSRSASEFNLRASLKDVMNEDKYLERSASYSVSHLNPSAVAKKLPSVNQSGNVSPRQQHGLYRASLATNAQAANSNFVRAHSASSLVAKDQSPLLVGYADSASGPATSLDDSADNSVSFSSETQSLLNERGGVSLRRSSQS